MKQASENSSCGAHSPQPEHIFSAPAETHAQANDSARNVVATPAPPSSEVAKSDHEWFPSFD